MHDLRDDFKFDFPRLARPGKTLFALSSTLLHFFAKAKIIKENNRNKNNCS